MSGKTRLDPLLRALREVEGEARELPWAHERAWRVETHVWTEEGVLVIDLHDLSVRLAELAVRQVGEVAGQLSVDRISFVTGVGRRSVGPPKLGRAVKGELARLCKKRGWSYAPGRSGRWELVLDGKGVPSRLSWPIWLGGLAFGLAALVFVPPLGVVILALLTAAFWANRRGV